MKSYSKKIISCELIKVEKQFNKTEKQKYFYNIELEGIEDLLLVETTNQITEMKYPSLELNKDTGGGVLSVSTDVMFPLLSILTSPFFI